MTVRVALSRGIRLLGMVALAALVLPSVAHAGDVAMRVQDVPLEARSLAAAVRPMHFNMLALHWIGSGSVGYRVHRLHGAWSGWVVAGEVRARLTSIRITKYASNADGIPRKSEPTKAGQTTRTRKCQCR